MVATPEWIYDRWLAELTPETIREMFVDRGCTQVMVKALSDRQDNDKNQVYVGPDLSDLAWMPSGEVVASSTRSCKPGAPGKTKFTVPVDFTWLGPKGASPAPAAKLIFYPQYPEVRLSGLIAGSPDPPRNLYSRIRRGQEAGRRLLIGTNPSSSTVWALMLPPEAVAGPRLDEVLSEDLHGVFRLWNLRTAGRTKSTAMELLAKLREVHDHGWVPGQILKPEGPVPYRAQNGGGYTLEALCGVLPNGDAKPDYLGWELKAHSTNPITLFTPAPTGGFITDVVMIDFMRRFGWHSDATADKPERWDFNGRHLVGLPNKKTRLSLAIDGWDGAKNFSPDGGVQLVTDDGFEVARWGFEKLMNLWKTKHSRTAYVPYGRRTVSGGSEYHYDSRVLLCSGTTFRHLLDGFEGRSVFYDPGLNVKWQQGRQGFRWKSHERHQFRSTISKVEALYDGFRWVDVMDGASELNDWKWSTIVMDDTGTLGRIPDIVSG